MKEIFSRKGEAEREIERGIAQRRSIAPGKQLVYRFVKRAFDIAASVLGLSLLSPVFLVTIAAIVVEDGVPIIYKQDRIGKDCRAFKIYKFRSMVKNADEKHEKMREKLGEKEVSFKLKEDPRITKVGYWIRKFNIDELPQLINIIKGDMSIVGPRPLPDYEYEEEQRRYGKKYMERYSVPQGLTCRWQLSNRAEVSFEERMQMDVEYARSCTLTDDIKMIIETLLRTVSGKAGY